MVIKFKKNKTIQQSNIFIIGVSSFGYEFMKAFTLVAFSTKTNKSNKVTITDDDNIGISNLNRQFLYRNIIVRKSKSITACEVVKEMNPEFNCYALNNRI